MGLTEIHISLLYSFGYLRIIVAHFWERVYIRFIYQICSVTKVLKCNFLFLSAPLSQMLLVPMLSRIDIIEQAAFSIQLEVECNLWLHDFLGFSYKKIIRCFVHMLIGVILWMCGINQEALNRLSSSEF
jgi:hypothetical protein